MYLMEYYIPRGATYLVDDGEEREHVFDGVLYYPVAPLTLLMMVKSESMYLMEYYIPRGATYLVDDGEEREHVFDGVL